MTLFLHIVSNKTLQLLSGVRRESRKKTDVMTKDAPACAPATDGLTKQSVLIQMMCLQVRSQCPHFTSAHIYTRDQI